MTWKMSKKRTARNENKLEGMNVRTNEVAKAGAKLDLGLDKGGAKVFECDKENLFHLVGQLAQACEGLGGNGGEDLGSQDLEDFLIES